MKFETCGYRVINSMALARFKYLCGHPERNSFVCKKETCALNGDDYYELG